MLECVFATQILPLHIITGIFYCSQLAFQLLVSLGKYSEIIHVQQVTNDTVLDVTAVLVSLH